MKRIFFSKTNILPKIILRFPVDVSFKALKKFFQIRFEMCNKNKQRDVYTYFTTSTDTKLMKIVIETSL